MYCGSNIKKKHKQTGQSVRAFKFSSALLIYLEILTLDNKQNVFKSFQCSTLIMQNVYQISFKDVFLTKLIDPKDELR